MLSASRYMLLDVHSNPCRLIRDGGGGSVCVCVGGGGYLCPTNHTGRRDHLNGKTLGSPAQKCPFTVSTIVRNKVTISQPRSSMLINWCLKVKAKSNSQRHHVFVWCNCTCNLRFCHSILRSPPLLRLFVYHLPCIPICQFFYSHNRPSANCSR